MDETRDFEAELTAMKTRFDERQRGDNPLGWENTAAVFASILDVQRQYIDVLLDRLAAVEVERDAALAALTPFAELAHTVNISDERRFAMVMVAVRIADIRTAFETAKAVQQASTDEGG